MTRERSVYEDQAAFPPGVLVQTVLERPTYCTCVWVVAKAATWPATLMRLNRANRMCPSMSDHVSALARQAAMAEDAERQL